MPDAPARPGFTAPLRFFARQLTPLQLKSLLAAVMATIAGAAGVAYQWWGGSGTDALNDAASDATWGQWASTRALSWGLAFIAAFVVFFILRRYVLRAMGILVLVLVAAGAVSYFTGIDLNLARAQEAYDSASGWVWGQVNAVMDVVKRNLGGTVAAGVGAFLGGRRK
jgi:hypothetical protein